MGYHSCCRRGLCMSCELLPVFWSTPNGSSCRRIQNSIYAYLMLWWSVPLSSHAALNSFGVAYANELCGLHVFEFHPLKELVAQSTLKRFSTSILPGACRGHRDRLRPHPQQPVHQDAQLNSDPLSLLMRLGIPQRPITRAKVFRKSAPVRGPEACNTRHSRVYSSTKVSHLSAALPPSDRG